MKVNTRGITQISIPSALRDELKEAFPNSNPTKIINELVRRAIDGQIDMGFLALSQKSASTKQ